MNNRVYHVLKREIGDYTHYSELPICFEGNKDECHKHLKSLGFFHTNNVIDKDATIMYRVYGHSDADYEYLIV